MARCGEVMAKANKPIATTGKTSRALSESSRSIASSNGFLLALPKRVGRLAVSAGKDNHRAAP